MATLESRLSALELRLAPKARPIMVIFSGDDEATERAKFIAARGVEPAGVVVVTCVDARVQNPSPDAPPA